MIGRSLIIGRMREWSLACCVAVAGMLAAPSQGMAENECRLAAEQGGMVFPVDKLTQANRCLVGGVANSPTTSGLVGPVRTPISAKLYEYLLDRPPVIAALLQRLNMANYQFTPKGPQQYWGNDGDGTQGLLSLVHQDAGHRIYHIDGFHEGHVFPMVRARAVVFMKLTPQTGQDGRPAVETALAAFTKLNDPVLSGLVWMLRPLVGEAVTRKLARGFEATNQLAAAIAQDPARVVQEVPSVETLSLGEQRTLIAMIQALMPSSSSAVAPLRATP